MAFRANTITPHRALEQIKAQAVQLQRLAQNRRDRFAAGDVGADVILALLDNLLSQQTMLDNLSTAPGLVEYAKDQENDQNYDVVVEYAALTQAISGVISEITTTFPSATFLTLNPDGTRTFQTHTPAQTAPLRTALDAVSSAIT